MYFITNKNPKNAIKEGIKNNNKVRLLSKCEKKLKGSDEEDVSAEKNKNMGVWPKKLKSIITNEPMR